MGNSSCASYYQLTSFSCLGNVKAKMPNKNVKNTKAMTYEYRYKETHR